jgi:hypothetical protein
MWGKLEDILTRLGNKIAKAGEDGMARVCSCCLIVIRTGISSSLTYLIGS